MGKNKVTKPNKRNNPIYKKVTSKSNVKAKSKGKGKNKSKSVKTSVAKAKITNQKVREELDSKWKTVQADAAKGASTSSKTLASTSAAAKPASSSSVDPK